MKKIEIKKALVACEYSGRVRDALTALGLDNSQLRADASRASNILKGIGDSAEAEGARIDNAYKKIAGAVGGYFTISAAQSFIKEIVKVRGEVESLSISFETLLGNKQKADALFSQIKEFAAKTPLELTPLAKGAQTLLSFNIEAEKVMPLLKQIGDISMGKQLVKYGSKRRGKIILRTRMGRYFLRFTSIRNSRETLSGKCFRHNKRCIGYSYGAPDKAPKEQGRKN